MKKVILLDANNLIYRARYSAKFSREGDAAIVYSFFRSLRPIVEKFNPDFSKYDVVLSNYNGASWKKETKESFVKYIKEGGSLVVVHAADNSFPQWKEFNEMIGLGGWGGRNEKDGPYVYWKDVKASY